MAKAIWVVINDMGRQTMLAWANGKLGSAFVDWINKKISGRLKQALCGK